MTDSPNVELVRSIYADWERGDFSAAEWAREDMEYVHADGLSPDSWEGLPRTAGGLRDFLSAWENYKLAVEEYRELDDDRMIVLVRRTGRGKTSGIELGELQSKGAHLFDLRGGKVARLVVWNDRDRAFADLGLEPGGDPP